MPSAEDDPFTFSLDVDDDEEEDGGDDAMDLSVFDSPQVDLLHSGGSELPPSSNKLKLKLNKALSTSASPFYSATALSSSSSSSSSTLAFHYHPSTLLSLYSQSSKALNVLDGPSLTALAQDLHALQREAKERALGIESVLRSMELGGEGAMEGEEWYQEAIKYLHGVDVTDDFMGPDEPSGGGVDQRLQGKKRNKKSHSKRGSGLPGAAAGDASQADGEEEGGEGEEGEDDEFGAKKKNLTAKEKAVALKSFWEHVDGWMAFPTAEQVEAVKEVDVRAVGGIGPLGPYYAREAREREWREEKEREREKERGKDRDSEKDGKKRKKDKKACFATRDMQILTEDGFLGWKDVMARLADGADPVVPSPMDGSSRVELLQRTRAGRSAWTPPRVRRTLNVACYDVASQGLQYCPITEEDVIHQRSERLYRFHEDSAPCSGVDLRLTDDHRLYVEAGNERTWSRKAGDVGAGSESYDKLPASELIRRARSDGRDAVDSFRFLAFAAVGVQRDECPLTPPFADALELRSDDEVDAFLELLGYWLRGGSSGWSADRGRVLVLQATQQSQCDYLDDLFTRLRDALPVLLTADSAYEEGRLAHSHCVRVDLHRSVPQGSTSGPTRFYRIHSPRWVQLLGEQRCHLDGEVTSGASRPLWQQLSARALRRLLKGLCTADGGHHSVEPGCTRITASSPRFRDEVQCMAINAGYATHWQRSCTKGDIVGYRHCETGAFVRARPDSADLHGFSPVLASRDEWAVSYTDDDRLVAAGHSSAATRPVVRYAGGVTAEKAADAAGHDVWCVHVPHPDHLIIARRVLHHPSDGSLLAASTPVVISNCNDEKEERKERKVGKERERRDKEREKERAKDQRKLNEAQRLGLLYVDDSRVRKQIVDTDRALASLLTPASASTSSPSTPAAASHAPAPNLLQRVLACFVEQQGLPHPIPYIPPSVVKKSKKKSTKAGQKSPPSLPLDERLRLELKAAGLLTSADLSKDYAERADDELCAQLRLHHSELRQVTSANNGVRRSMHALGSRLVDHRQRLELLSEAEQQLAKSYKKKKLSDNAAQKAVEAFVHSQQRVGSRRRITGYVPHPRDMTGVPRVIADSVVAHPSYRDVLMADDLPPLQPQAPAYYARYSRNSALIPPSSLPPLLSHLSSPAYPPSPGGGPAYYTGSPLPAFSSHNSPLGLEEGGSPVRGRGVEDGEAGEGGDGAGEGLDVYANNIGALPLTQPEDNVFAF